MTAEQEPDPQLLAVDQPPDPEAAFRLLGDQRFMRYIWAKFLSLAGQNALIYGLFIAVITRQESSLATSAFVLASVIPSIVLSLPGGLFADLTPNKFGLLSTLGLRIVVVYFFFDLGGDIETVIGLTFMVWTVYQFFSPAENAAVLALVPQERLPHASSMLQAISLAAQLVGAGIIAPLAVELLDTNGVYVVVFIMLCASFVLFAMIPNLSVEQEQEAQRLSPWRALPVGFKTIRADERLATVTLIRVLVDTGLMSFIVIAPIFIEDTLNLNASYAVYIAMPGALGIALGLIVSPGLLLVTSSRWLAIGGFFLFVAVLLVLPFLDTIAPELTTRLGPFRDLQEWVNLSDGLVATMFLLPIAGLGISFVQVAARTEVYQSAPAHVIAQVFSTQSAIGSVAALVPTFIVGLMLDLLPVVVVLEGLAVILIVIAAYVLIRGSHFAETPGPAEGERPAGMIH